MTSIKLKQNVTVTSLATWVPHVTLEALLKNHNHNHVRRKGKKRIKH